MRAKTLSPRCALLLAALLVSCFSTSLAKPAPAAAGVDLYCDNILVYGLSSCTGDRHSLRQSRAYASFSNGYIVGAAAVGYAGTVFGVNYACHSYSGANLLYPEAYNPQSDNIVMDGMSLYGDEPACP